MQKRMPDAVRKQLMMAAEMISNEKESCICQSIGKDWIKSSEAQMIRPDIDTDDMAWWGLHTMGYYLWEPEAIAARLMGIALMLTMPSDILNHRCCPAKSKV